MAGANGEDALIQRLLGQIDALLQGAEEFWAFKDSYPKALSHIPMESMNRAQFDFFSAIDEQLFWVSRKKWPTDEELSDGVISVRGFMSWLRGKRSEYAETTATAE